ncbi:DNA-binding transcriptional MocR family regulator [Luteibacter sp. Sphag1AF]|uniref:aminotransferase-like domain-containing protein n=1 Tax=Luteibacter sp. Sphag1AF TaxID=2587031 RepID=UPI0018573D7B|nr:PLP-dependent aminotransferase family protein [Luteibacter sp. Sphag1AF]MBB3228534.1 DNA-binding transcriptional MocR family regulator [Luteibacter sp. Sphag1AF]
MYLRIVQGIESAVAEGSLRTGDRMPAQRHLARVLGVDLTTITRAYDEAKARKLLIARGALGTFVAAAQFDLAQLIDLGMNIPPMPEHVDFAALLRQGIGQVLTHADPALLMTYHPGGGSDADRRAGALWLKPLLGNVPASRIVTCPGSQAALAALVLAHTLPGDAVAMEPLVYPGIMAAVRQLGRRVVAVHVDADGMCPEALGDACQRDGVRLLYLNPALQNPVATTMPATRRQAIVEVARRCHIPIVEDDPYSLLAPEPPPPLAALAPDNVHYIGTLSKCLTPGLRTAYVVSPDATGQQRFLHALRSVTLMSTPLMTSVATQWIHDGTAAQLLADIRAECAARQEMAARALRTRDLAIGHGIHIWHALPDHWTSMDLARDARAEGLAVRSSEAFRAGAHAPNAIRISLGGVAQRARLGAALKRLAALIERGPDHGDVII